MVVHPAAGHESGTLVNALLHRVQDLSGVGGELRPGIVHRLDKGTSGADGRREARQRPRVAVASVRGARGREGVRRAGLGRRAGGPAHRPADWTRSERPAEDVSRAPPRAIGRDAHHEGASLSRRHAVPGRHRRPDARTRSASTSAPSAIAIVGDATYGGARARVAADLQAGALTRPAVPPRASSSSSRTPSTAGRWSAKRRSPGSAGRARRDRGAASRKSPWRS